jgi:hypothetical protein
MKLHGNKLIYILLIFLLNGCATSQPVRHLSSDVCLVMPDSTTKAEVLSFLGEPDLRQSRPNGDETWFYFKKNESFIKKLPILGQEFGESNYETVTVSFVGEQVRTCTYRQLKPEEFQGQIPQLDGQPDE